MSCKESAVVIGAEDFIFSLAVFGDERGANLCSDPCGGHRDIPVRRQLGGRAAAAQARVAAAEGHPRDQEARPPARRHPLPAGVHLHRGRPRRRGGTRRRRLPGVPQRARPPP
jgi:hypothetical protein